MKKKIYTAATVVLSALALFLSSCLKDDRFVDFSKAGTIVEFPLGGVVNFGADAITETPDSTPNGAITRRFSVNVASAHAPSKETKITFAVDNSLIAAYNAANPLVTYLPMPTDAYVFDTTSVTIPGGQHFGFSSVTFFKNKLDPALSYMLPVKISDASGLNISGNKGVHYYHFIGNDFAGAYLWDYTRTPPNGNFVGANTTLSPVTPNQFETNSGYYTGTIRYEVTFSKEGSGANARYYNFQVAFNQDDVENILTANDISVTAQPVINVAGYDENKRYTYAEALQLFEFKYSVLGTSGARTVVDRY